MGKLQKMKAIKMTKIDPLANKIIKTKKCAMKRQVSKFRNETTSMVKSEPKKVHIVEVLDTKNYKDGVRVLFEIASKTESQNKRQLLDEADDPIFLHIVGVKIPKCRDHTERIGLPHSYYSDDLEICFISADLPNSNLRDYDKVTQHYENLLKDQGVRNIKKIMSFHELRNEYQEFEMKRKLTSAYNLFLADSKIHGKVVHFLGNTFNKARKFPRVLSFDKPNIKSQIERILSQADFKIHNKGNSTGIQVGRIGMKQEHVLDNVNAVSTKLSTIYPGGSANIRSINIKTTRSMAVPLYLTLKMKSKVDVPKLEPTRPKNSVNYTGELSTRIDTVVTVLPSGNVRTKRIKKRANRNISKNNDESYVKSLDNDDDQHSNGSPDCASEDLNIGAKKETASLIELDQVKKVSETTLPEDGEIKPTRDDEDVSTRVDNKIVKSPKEHRRSIRKKSPGLGVKTPQNATPHNRKLSNTPKGDVNFISTANSGLKRKVTPLIVKGTPKTLKDNRKSTSFSNTGSQKKRKLMKSPFFKGNIPK